ncbi:hypothetical protein B7755_052220 [Streptomyces sp. NBS 14/10]|uniref:hypothetical protein n=1 Tax=Streptomyces sp. NBS 14/10 TaxID=1945643 RepID=UPI00117F71B0|nr:hypothetical protein [Streptomyces sp. NBS 14/10]KAK1176673.1 hypothetical protein B7755_052220 [Streptomyces sp. NBS 14/10]
MTVEDTDRENGHAYQRESDRFGAEATERHGSQIDGLQPDGGLRDDRDGGKNQLRVRSYTNAYRQSIGTSQACQGYAGIIADPFMARLEDGRHL